MADEYDLHVVGGSGRMDFQMVAAGANHAKRGKPD